MLGFIDKYGSYAQKCISVFVENIAVFVLGCFAMNVKVRLAIPTGRQGFLFCYKARGAAGHGHPHQHRELELNVGLTGQAWVLSHNKRLPLFERSLVWLFPEHEHMIIEQSEDFSMLVVVFRERLVRAGQEGRRGQEQPRPVLPPRRLSRGNFETLEPIWTALLKGGRPAYFNAGLAWFYHEASRCYDQEQNLWSEEIHPAVERAAVWLRNHPETANLAELARRVGVSSPWLSRLFKKQMGISLARFRTEQRLQEFQSRRRMDSHCTLTEAAYASGFNTYTQFFRAYRQARGSMPSQKAGPTQIN